MNKSILVALILIATVCSRPAFCQASWGYHFDFVLTDQQDNPVGTKQINSGDYQLFTRVQGSTGFYCSSKPGHFALAGTAVNTPVYLGLINDRDTTVVCVPNGAGGMNLANWPAKPGIYRIELSQGIKDSQVQAIESSPQKRPSYLLTVADWSKYRLIQSRRDIWKQYFGLGYGERRFTQCP